MGILIDWKKIAELSDEEVCRVIDEVIVDDSHWEEVAETCWERVQNAVSPSQVTTYELCARKWVLSSIYGLRQPSTKALKLGTAVHAEIEHYYETGEVRDTPLKRMVLALIEKMPKPGPTIASEEWIAAATYPGGPMMRGKGDILELDEHHPHVWDVKTSSDVRRYGKREQDLPHHTQLTVYQKAALDQFKKADKISGTLVHVQTRGTPITSTPSLISTRAEVEARYAKIVDTVQAMLLLVDRGVPKFEDVTPNTASCDAYGGCEYKGVCGEGGRGALLQLRRGSLMRKFTEETDRELEVLSPKVEKPKREAHVMGKLSDMMNKDMAKNEMKQETKTPVGETLPEGKKQCPKCKGSRYMKSPDGPPGAFLRCDACGSTGFVDAEESPIKVTFEWADGTMHDTPEPTTPKTETKAEVKVDAVLSPDAPATDSLKSAGPPEEKPKKEKKTKKAETEVKVTDVPSIPPPGNGTPKILYVDCVPTKGRDKDEAVHFEDWVAPIMAKTALRLGKADYRLQEYTAEAELAVDIRTAISAGKLPRVMLVTSLAKARATFLEQAVPVVDVIVRGV